jgi:8-oxo-dGTP pyrophosphatase MutT (NUDIX family)
MINYINNTSNNKNLYINNNMNYTFNKYKNIQCLNCGYYGHTIKTCNYPITSYGIICYCNIGNNIKYLMIQRKDSLCYIEFLRGKYRLDNIKYLCNLFKYITLNEKKFINKNNFDILWKKLWKDYDINKFKKEYIQSKKKFDKLKEGFIYNDELINFDYIIKNSENNIKIYNETEWEFPKGRRNLNEQNIKCAIREFEEESGLIKENIKLVNNKSYEEIYIAVNNVRYRHIYYLAKCVKFDDNTFNLFNPENKIQIKEVRDVKWLNYNNVIDNIRSIYIERIELFKRVTKIIKKLEFIN